ncbi:unnamed protein product [Rotaria socialis]|uniref:Nudix hydrolase domain-containing protein n=3 Tax=Rotaria TaxID=231623 RepID=A0A820UQ51_9BILA|nr:unnamed protein product [Rotaria socialis]CAF4674020.1 unnamed protein product [Rotaria socialis]
MIHYIFIFLLLIYTSYECEIWKTSDCPPGPTKEDEDFMRLETYTKEQLFTFCDAGKTYADCINERLHCCDMRVEYATTLASLDAQLKRIVWRVGKYCTGITETSMIHYRCLTTHGSLLSTTVRTTTTPMPMCDIENAGRVCSPMIQNRVHFESHWSVYEKAKWCKDAYDYYTCALAYITNCTTLSIVNEIDQLTLFLDFIEKSANRECPGGLYGCGVNAHSDMRCRAGAKYQSMNNNKSSSNDWQSYYLRSNSNKSYLKNNVSIDDEQNTQEYRRFRKATNQLSAKTSMDQNSEVVFPCYLAMANKNKNEYSRYKDSRFLQRKPNNAFDSTQPKAHKKCRSSLYSVDVKRFPVPDEKVFWHTTFLDYFPNEYTTEKVQRNPRADPCDPSEINKFNQLDTKIDRRSFTGHYYVDPITNRPRNPIGRTGITGRGRLYYWGPNHAGDSVITRWHHDEKGTIVRRQANCQDCFKPVLEFVTIQRKDTKEWALPGGMVDPGEHISSTVKREFQEEAMQDGIEEHYISKLFSNGYKLFEWYADDPRNTDNAWIETVAINFHDETGQLTKHIHLDAGDDATNVAWRPIDRNIDLYASHKEILKRVVDRFDAYW